MKKSTRSVLATAALAAAGLAVSAGAAGAATAAPRITSGDQLRASIAAAASAQSLGPVILPGQPTGIAPVDPFAA